MVWLDQLADNQSSLPSHVRLHNVSLTERKYQELQRRAAVQDAAWAQSQAESLHRRPEEQWRWRERKELRRKAALAAVSLPSA
eukprot:CAMPEP_0182895524 /NCGR_PEP_ID=MMETSP0034_2-20130328/25738_1 /TAXON_ID=156128 /ORGANISM="Nephroselmis pyriformis, Strain CCMP717" /LENGTH=82 /DNA_ID=CAMNT_0025029359 /DNA_START=68 /DNA_END=313 /DNA_ORIENTATION=+